MCLRLEGLVGLIVYLWLLHHKGAVILEGPAIPRRRWFEDSQKLLESV